MTIHISVVIPVYGCKTALIELCFRLKESLSKITEDFEILMVNDASPDGSWETITELSVKDSRVKGLDLSRNFGQHYAITAGLDYCTGDWVVVMDCDMQDLPEEIIKLYNKAQEGFDIVLGQRENRKDSFMKRQLSKLYYKVLSYSMGTEMDSSIGTFRIMSKQVVESFCSMHERLRFFGAMVNWLGFNVCYLPIIHASRKDGKSSYSFSKMLSLGLNGILSFSDKPLRLTIKMGMFITTISVLFIMYKILNTLIIGHSEIGWSSLIASIFFSTGLIISVLGVIGLYIGKIFDEIKGRPIYIVKNKKNL